MGYFHQVFNEKMHLKDIIFKFSLSLESTYCARNIQFLVPDLERGELKH